MCGSVGPRLRHGESSCGEGRGKNLRGSLRLYSSQELARRLNVWKNLGRTVNENVSGANVLVLGPWMCDCENTGQVYVLFVVAIVEWTELSGDGGLCWNLGKVDTAGNTWIFKVG